MYNLRPRPVRIAALVALALTPGCTGTDPRGRPAAGLPAAPLASPTAPVLPIAVPDGEDILAEALAWDSDRYQHPPTSFRAGHVTRRTLDPTATAPGRHGFTVQLPSRAPVASPAVYQDTVFVSGGFRSREFYAFAARTGEPRWAVDLDDDGPSTAACDRGICVFNTESCTVFAVDARTGEMLWSHWLGDPLMSAPTIAGGLVFTAYPAGNAPAYGANPAANAAAPAQNAGPAAGAAPGAAVHGPSPGAPATDSAAAPPGAAKPRPPGTSHVLAALDLQTGASVWQRWLDSDVMSAPVAVGGAVHVATFAGTLLQFEQHSGALLAAQRARATSAPVVRGDALYFTRRTDADAARSAVEGVVRQGRSSGTVDYVAAQRDAPYLDADVQARSAMGSSGRALDTANGFAGGAPAAANPQPALANVGQASVSTLQAFQGSRVLSDGQRNITTMGDEVVCTDPVTGAKLWSVQLAGDLARAGGSLAAPPAAAGGRLFVATLAGEVLQMSPETGAIERRYPVGAPVRSQPVIDGGWIYVGTEDGKLVAINTGDPDLTGWPMWGGGPARTGLAPATSAIPGASGR